MCICGYIDSCVCIDDLYRGLVGGERSFVRAAERWHCGADEDQQGKVGTDAQWRDTTRKRHMKFPLTRSGIISSLIGVLVLSSASPTLAWTNRTAAGTDTVAYDDACDAYWMARGYYPHFFGSAACYAPYSPYDAQAWSGAAMGLERHGLSPRTRHR
jgi:hypothetical protein